MIYLIPFLAFVLLIADFRITHSNTSVAWNGFGSLKNVITGKSDQPMQYRVLVPWLYWLFARTNPKPGVYISIKYVGLLFMLYSFHWYLGVLGVTQSLGTAVLCAVIPITMLYDYADAYYELGFLSLAFGLIIGGYSIWLLSLVTFMAVLNRETGIVILVALLAKGIIYTEPYVVQAVIIGLAIIAGLSIPRLLYGKKPRYCQFNQLKNNWAQMKKEFPHPMSGYVHCVLLLMSFVVLTVLRINHVPKLSSLIFANIIFLSLLLIPGKWNETRIFLPLTTVMIPMGLY